MLSKFARELRGKAFGIGAREYKLRGVEARRLWDRFRYSLLGEVKGLLRSLKALFDPATGTEVLGAPFSRYRSKGHFGYSQAEHLDIWEAGALF